MDAWPAGVAPEDTGEGIAAPVSHNAVARAGVLAVYAFPAGGGGLADNPGFSHTPHAVSVPETYHAFPVRSVTENSRQIGPFKMGYHIVHADARTEVIGFRYACISRQKRPGRHGAYGSRSRVAKQPAPAHPPFWGAGVGLLLLHSPGCV